MPRARDDILHLLAESGGVLLLGQHRSWAPTISRMVRAGILTSVLPGVVVDARDDRLSTRLLAVGRRYPDAVVTGRAAAALTYWPDLAVREIAVARPTGTVPRPGFVFTRRRVAGGLVAMTGPVRHTVPAATAIDLCAGDIGADALDEVLRRRAATLAQLRAAYAKMPGRRGNAERLRLLIDSRDEPWSAAERLTHRLLRSASLSGWLANFPVQVGHRRYYLDVAFPQVKVAIEVESIAFHSSIAQLHSDRLRQNLLTAAGWTVLRIDWRMITEQPETVVRLIRAAVAAKGM